MSTGFAPAHTAHSFVEYTYICANLKHHHEGTLRTASHHDHVLPLSFFQVIPVQARSDNWMYLVVDEASGEAAVVDPYDATKINAAAAEQGVNVTALITTHHHHDHSGGNERYVSWALMCRALPADQLQLELNPGIKAYGGSDMAPGTNTIVGDGDAFKLGSIDVRCLATPCHTQDSIAFFVEDKAKNQRGVFTG